MFHVAQQESSAWGRKLQEMTQPIWRCPYRGVYPQSSSIDGISHAINHINGDPRDELETPISERANYRSLPSSQDLRSRWHCSRPLLCPKLARRQQKFTRGFPQVSQRLLSLQAWNHFLGPAADGWFANAT